MESAKADKHVPRVKLWMCTARIFAKKGNMWFLCSLSKVLAGERGVNAGVLDSSTGGFRCLNLSLVARKR